MRTNGQLLVPPPANRAGRGPTRSLGPARQVLVLLLACAGAVVAPGCGDGKGAAVRLNPRDTSYMVGIPLPAGFSLNDKLSEDHGSGGSRIGRHSYTGRANDMAVRDFYIEQMPLQGWELVDRHFVKGRTTLRFERKNESCTMEIFPSGIFNRVTIQVFVMPFSRTSTEPPPRRPVP